MAATETPLIQEVLERILTFTPHKYSDKTKSLIFDVLKLTHHVTAMEAMKFIARIANYNDEQVSHGLGKFFQNEYHLKGYEWQWAAGMIRREGRYKASQLKNKLSGIPTEKV
jgi:hypothetical protein